MTRCWGRTRRQLRDAALVPDTGGGAALWPDASGGAVLGLAAGGGTVLVRSCDKGMSIWACSLDGRLQVSIWACRVWMGDYK